METIMWDSRDGDNCYEMVHGWRIMICDSAEKEDVVQNNTLFNTRISNTGNYWDNRVTKLQLEVMIKYVRWSSPTKT